MFLGLKRIGVVVFIFTILMAGSALTDSGANVTAVDDVGRTSLHYAALNNQTKAMADLLESGADLHARDRRGETPLHMAARRGRKEAAKVLLANGADVNSRDTLGKTPLHLAADQGPDAPELEQLLISFAQLLLDHGADPSIRDHDGLSAGEYAKSRGHHGLAELLGSPVSVETRTPDSHCESGAPSPSGYRTYAEVGTFLQSIETSYPSIAKRYDLGQSVLGRSLWAIRLSDNVLVEEDEPEFRYSSSMHGDEIMGVELCLLLVDYLTTNYGTDSRITDIINDTEIWIVPLANPDGYVSGSRYNNNGYDLNRNYPDPFSYTGPIQPETQVMMDWFDARSFTLAANYHGGALVVNYPYDNDNKGSGVYATSPDDDVHIWISEEYSQHNLPMWNSSSFYHGITNGAAWYEIDGGQQDYSYRYTGCNEVTIEVSDNKEPPSSQIPTFWNENRESMLAYMEAVHIGLRGIVTAGDTGLPLAATITVSGRESEVYTDPDVGDYHRMLMPGTYDFLFEADGYDQQLYTGVVVSSGAAARLDVSLPSPAALQSPNGGENLSMGSPVTVSWTGESTAQFHVQQTFNYGLAVTTDDFESGTLDPAYSTGGDNTWSVSTSSAHGGSYAARAGSITHYEDSWLTRTVSGGDLSFWYRVSSESNYDFFNFYIDGDRQIHVSGDGSWTYYSTTLTSGSHELKWEYTKDVSESHYSDTAWIDDLQITEDATVWSDVVALTSVGVTSVEWTPLFETDSAKIRVRAYYGAGGYGKWDESDQTFEVNDNQPRLKRIWVKPEFKDPLL